MGNGLRMPTHSRGDLCSFVFRKSTTCSEEGMKPDIELVYQMLDRGIRVEDLINDLMFGAVTKKTQGLLDWVYQRNKEIIPIKLNGE